MLKLFKKSKDKIPKSEIITEPKEPKTPPVSKCGKPLQLDNCRWEASNLERICGNPLNFGQRRLHKELMSLIKEPPPGVTVDTESVQQNLSEWKINIKGFEGTLYEGEDFQLLFKFNNKYPFDSPEVTFIGSNIPVHPHVYSNGHICLSILTEDWSPALSVQSVCLSIASMLSSCREKKRPPDNTLYVKTCNKNPKKTKWWYHDDSV
ncbi:ubiquitin-conjugating enzyme E2 W isoform X1 [Drosophila bipectinata]|uniref:ubiquitin-conjugating enzyme E2 W isoform X1 n=1 Tax=Drosophila bipectinata TaxID=42026 RepID=UPI001C8A4B08|nr:ubiquitin-conjugating enzyme E2 W isoform X1 [Drosophila bipectinata]